MSIETIARRYATALADVVQKSGEADRVREELKQWETLLTANADLRTALDNPAIAHAGKERVLDKLIERSAPSRTTSNFLKILLRNGRIGDLAAINEKFASVMEERSGVVAASITSARELPEDEKAELRQNLERLTGKRVNINFGVDGEMIGGVVTRIGSTVYDGSVRTMLENLKQDLTGA